MVTSVTFRLCLKSTYGGSLAFFATCPILAFVPIVFEMLQHVVEAHLGMYESAAAWQASSESPVRLAFGFLKVLALIIPIYWVTRFLARRDAAFAARADAKAVRLFAGFLLVQAAIAAVELFILPRSGTVAVVWILAGQLLECLLCGWAVAAALGNANVGPLSSIRFMARSLPWTFAFLVAAMLPLMVLHYLLAGLAIMAPKSLLTPTLILDSLVVGYLSLVLAASGFYAALRAARLTGVSLIPQQSDLEIGTT